MNEREFQTAQEEELLSLLLAEEGIDLAENRAITSRKNIGVPVPLSYTQEGLWFLSQLEPNSPFYNLSAAVSLTGNLDIAILKQSINTVLSRHEILRTNIVKKYDKAFQIIKPNLEVNLELIDLKKYPISERSQKVNSIESTISQKPFDLANDSLIRFTLLELTAEERILLITIHHIITDGYSWVILIQEIGKCYQDFSRNDSLSLPELSIQYGDYALWQKEQLAGEKLDKLVDYWKQQLVGIPPLLELPCDRPRLAIQSYKGNTKSSYISLQLTKKLKQLSQAENVSLFMLLQAAFAVLLHRYSRQSDIVIGSPIANRNLPELEKLIGFFANNLVLRTQFTEGMTFKELLTQVRQTTLDGYEHQELPFGKMVDELQPERDLSRNPLFQVMFSLQNAPLPALKLPNLNLTPVVNFNTNTARFDLEVNFWEEGEQLKGDWLYSTDLFYAATIDRMMAHFQILLIGIVANPQQTLAELPLITAAERELLATWNDTKVNSPQDKTIHQLFESQVNRTPDAVAVKFENQELTYLQLNQKANQLAHYLQTLGVKPETLVGICVDRSLFMVIGLLAILKAGGAYVPIDSYYPQARVDYIIEDSQIKLLLTETKHRDKFPQHNLTLINLDSPQSPTPSASQFPTPTSQNLAYVIYTSGSTGKPKGVMNQHSGVVNRLLWMQERYQLTNSDRILQKTPFSFDVSVWEFFWTLATGATLVIAKPEGHKDSSYLTNIIQQEQITTLHFVPSMLRVWLEEPTVSRCHSIKRAICSGEELPKELEKRFFSKLRCELHNLYGPTEAAIDVTAWQCQPESELNIVPIGKAISNTQIYILDKHLQPLPIGVPGELHIGGVQVARGYWHREELTQQKFIANPVGTFRETSLRGERLYKTGDRARYLPDGNIEYLGRIDNQVKIRGFRIELGEIESALSQHPDIEQTLVVVREDVPGNKKLVAYLVSNQTITIKNLRSHLKQKLPDYMIPGVFVTLDDIPLTPNGKINRRALPIPDTITKLETSASYIAPSTPIEKTLAAIWAEVLRIEQVGIEDNFFELGGDSILSLQIIAKAASAGIKITTKQIFQYQTIGELAAVATSTISDQVEQGLLTGKAPLTPIQHWFFEQELAQSYHWNMAWLLELEPNIKPELLKQAVEQLLIHHDALRLKFTSTISGWQQEYNQPKSDIPFTAIDLSTLETEKQSQQIEATANELQGSLDLASANLIKVVLFRLGNGKSDRLLIMAHHLVIDGVSWRIILEDLFTVYQQLEQEKEIKLPNKTTSWQEWGNKLTEYAESAVLKQELDYWLTIQSNQIRSIPTDYPKEKANNTVASVAQISVSLTEAQTYTLLQEVPAVYNTQINDILLTALVQSLTQWTKTESILINLEGHGREELFTEIDLSRTVGWFTTIFPVLLEDRRDSGLAEAIKSIKEQLRQVPNKGIGYGILHYLKQAEVTKQIPTGEISFNYLGQLDSAFTQGAILGLATESFGYTRSQSGKRRYLLEIDSLIIDGKLDINWNYSQKVHQSNTIQSLADNFLEKLQALITHCQAPETGGYTPSDFPLAKLNQTQLDKLIGQNRANIEDIYPLSPMQQGLLFHTIAEPESEFYFIQPTIPIQGDLDKSVFKQAWQKIVARHSLLRTSFHWSDLDRPVQLVSKQIDLPWVEYDWRDLDVGEQETKLQLLLEEDRQQGFELSRSLMRLVLIRLGESTYQFIWSFHHLILDGWSMHSLLKEMLLLYKALSQREQVSLSHPRPYKDYIAWLQQQDLAKAEKFWRKKLQGFNSPTQLPIDKGIAVDKQEVQTQYNCQLSLEMTNSLKSLAKQHRLTLSTLLQGAWALLLSHYSGETDVVFGATVSGRSMTDLPRVESMVGVLINSLPLRIRVDPQAELLSWLQTIQTQQLKQEEYAYTPLYKLQQWSDIPGGTSLFDSIIVFENYPTDYSQLNSSIEIGKIRSFEQNSYPLTIMVMPHQQLSILMKYDPIRLKPETITRMALHLQTLLKKIISKPEARVGELSLVQKSEKQNMSKKSLGKLKRIKRSGIKVSRE